MFHAFIDRGHRMVAGGILFGEIAAFFTADRVQQIGLLVTGALTFLSHYVWSNRKEKRKDRDEDEVSRRRNRLLDALERKVRSEMEAGKMPPPEILHLLTDRDLSADGPVQPPAAT